MPRPGPSHPGRVLVVILALVLGVLVVYDLSNSNSMLKAAWRDLFPGSTPGEELRDGVLDVLTPRE